MDLKMIYSYDTNLKLGKYSVFGQAGKSYFNEKLSLSFGIRTDINSYSASMSNPLISYHQDFQHHTGLQTN